MEVVDDARRVVRPQHRQLSRGMKVGRRMRASSGHDEPPTDSTQLVFKLGERRAQERGLVGGEVVAGQDGVVEHDRRPAAVPWRWAAVSAGLSRIRGLLVNMAMVTVMDVHLSAARRGVMRGHSIGCWACHPESYPVTEMAKRILKRLSIV
jgi:hypothetical protein